MLRFALSVASLLVFAALGAAQCPTCAPAVVQVRVVPHAGGCTGSAGASCVGSQGSGCGGAAGRSGGGPIRRALSGGGLFSGRHRNNSSSSTTTVIQMQAAPSPAVMVVPTSARQLNW